MEILILFLLNVIFFGKVIFQGLVPAPMDLLVGAYYPWHDFTWGYDVGPTIKNPLISDVFSQFYLWKDLIAASWQQGQIPLWNPYSYFGYPLLANFHSGALNPFNFLMVLLDNVNGWKLMIICQHFGSLLTMFLFLRYKFKKDFPAILGSISYAFSSFAITWSQFATAGFAMIWLPVFFLVLEKYFDSQKTKYLFWLTPLIFLLITAGHYQSLIYGYLLVCFYFLYKIRFFEKLKSKTSKNKKEIQGILSYSLASLLGFGLGAIQLLPTFELTSLSIRLEEKYIEQVNYGLLPLKNILTLFAPDYFGNPVTRNFWGFFNYHETVIYVSILGAMAFLSYFFIRQKKPTERFFFASATISLFLVFNSPLSRLTFLFKIPFISTSAAGRIILVFVFSVSVLITSWTLRIQKEKKLNQIQFWLLPLIFLTLILTTYFGRQQLTHYLPEYVSELTTNAGVALRNLVYPTAILGLLMTTIILFRKTKFFLPLLIIINLLDLFRFGWKYTPFVPQGYVFPETEITNFLQNQSGLFRVERERGPLLPPNTWTAYRLMSSSGYDPLGPENASRYFATEINGFNSSFNLSRYTEIERFDAQALGEVNVKYLLAMRRSPAGEYQENGPAFYYKIKPEEWKKVFASTNVFVLENTKFKPRARLFDSNQQEIGSVTITNYSPQEISLSYQSPTPATLIISDTFFPGWKAFLGNQEIPVTPFESTFRQLEVPAGDQEIVLKYQPLSFKIGLVVSSLSLLLWGLLLARLNQVEHA